MKKLLFLVIDILLSISLYSQRVIYRSSVYDGITFFPIEWANVYNYNTKQYTFTDKNGVFAIRAQAGDTLVISKSIYKQAINVITNEEIGLQINEYFLYYKAILLKEVNIYALNPTYEGFKKDVANLKLPFIDNVGLSAEELNEIKAASNAGNLLRGTPIANPVTYLYNKFNKKVKARELAYEMEQYNDEIENLPSKFNKEIVSDITGLKDDELMNFMVYCRFSYYDLIRWSPDVIKQKITSKFYDYEYFKTLEYNEK